MEGRIDVQTVLTVLESVLLPGYGISNWNHTQGQLHICSCSKEIDERMTKHLALVLEHPGKKKPLGGKHLVWWSELICKNFFLPWNGPCHREINRNLFCPGEYLLREIAHYTRHNKCAQTSKIIQRCSSHTAAYKPEKSGETQKLGLIKTGNSTRDRRS